MGQFESFIGVDFWTALFILLNTLLIFFVAKKFLFVPVHKIITDRQAEIDSMYADASKARADSQQLAEEYREKIADAQATSDRMIQEATVRGQNREAEIVRNAQDQANAILTRAAEDAALEKKKVLNNAKDEISAMAVAVAEKVIARELNESDQASLVDQFIDELGDEA